MNVNENFLRIVKEMYDAVKKVDYTGKVTEIEKLKELNRWNDEFIAQTRNVEKMLDDQMILGIIDRNDKSILEAAIREITDKYLTK